MRFALKFATISLAVALAAPAAVFADTIELTTGDRVEGTFKQATQTGVVIEVAGQSITIPLDKVRAIYLGRAPVVTEPKDSPANDAFNALKAMKSVTHSGLTYREYAPRVLDAKVTVDRYLGSTEKSRSELQIAIGLAMQYYELASQAWNAWIIKDFGKATEIGRNLREDRILGECPEIKAVIAQQDANAPIRAAMGIRDSSRTPSEEIAMFIGTSIGKNPDVPWACASAKIADAEKLIYPQDQ